MFNFVDSVDRAVDFVTSVYEALRTYGHSFYRIRHMMIGDSTTKNTHLLDREFILKTEHLDLYFWSSKCDSHYYTTVYYCHSLGSRPPIAVFYPATSAMCRCGLFASLCVYGSEMGVGVFVYVLCIGFPTRVLPNPKTRVLAACKPGFFGFEF